MSSRNFFRNVKEISKMVRVGKPSHPVVQVCPVCLMDTLTKQSSFLTFIVPTTYVCNNCDYSGPIYAEVDIEEYPTLLEKMSQESADISRDMEDLEDDI